jgi:hypothetical protein
METMAMVSSLLAMQANGAQGQVAASIIKANADAERFAVQTLIVQPSQANLAAGVGGALDRFA